MTLYELWRKIGKQHLKNIKGKQAIVFIEGEEYIISNVKYESGKMIGFETEKKDKKFNEICSL